MGSDLRTEDRRSTGGRIDFAREVGYILHQLFNYLPVDYCGSSSERVGERVEVAVWGFLLLNQEAV
jgi:hypothetical protein